MEQVASVGAIGGSKNVEPDLAVTNHFHQCVIDRPEDRGARRAAFSSGLADATGLVREGWIDDCH
eukprot:2781910-Alexandrium_andersonii.AAC.1